MAILQTVSTAPPFPNSSTLSLASYVDSTDTPAAGQQVIVVYSSTQLGTIQYTTGVVADSSMQLYGEYTSIQVTVDKGTLPEGSNGGLIFDFAGRLLGLLQTGNALSAIGGGSALYETTITGIKARYIKYFIDNAVAGANTSLPTLATYTQTRGISTSKRTVADLPGGVTNDAAGVGGANQLVSLRSNSEPAAIRLGVLSPNCPSFTDALLEFADRNGVGDTLTVQSATGGTLTTTGTSSAYIATYSQENWRRGTPPNSLDCTTGKAVTTQYIACSGQGKYFADNGATPCQQLTITNLQSAKIGEFVAQQHGAADSALNQYAAVIVYGNTQAVNFYIQGDPFMNDGFQPIPYTNPLAISVIIGGYGIDGKFAFANPITNPTGSGVFLISSQADYLQLTYADIVNTITTRSYTNPRLYNTWYYITTVKKVSIGPLTYSLSLNSVDSTACIASYLSGNTASAAITTVSTAPSTIY